MSSSTTAEVTAGLPRVVTVRARAVKAGVRWVRRVSSSPRSQPVGFAWTATAAVSATSDPASAKVSAPARLVMGPIGCR